MRSYIISTETTKLTFNTTWFKGVPGMIVLLAGKTITAFNFALEAGCITQIHTLRNPDKLRLFGSV
ncbi:MAG: hypothetical protein K0U86_13990 [Planctomycetes bacterium]|nr:hypothetical protein [Planctomycetota bacterium]